MELAASSSRWGSAGMRGREPVYQTATFRYPGLGRSTGFDYSRTGNPARRAHEDGICNLEGGPAREDMD